MNLSAQSISHKDVFNEIQKIPKTNHKLFKVNCPFQGMYSLSNFCEKDLYILFRKIGYAHRRDPYEYRTQVSDLGLFNFLESQNISKSNFILAGFFKFKEKEKITLSFFNKIGKTAKNRSYYININSIIDANSNSESNWYNAEGFRVNTIQSNLFYDKLKIRYHK
jgi:hypothetical protein